MQPPIQRDTSRPTSRVHTARLQARPHTPSFGPNQVAHLDLGLAVHLIQASMRGSLQALLPNASLWPLYPVPMSHGLKKRHQHSCRQHRQGLVCHAVAAKEALMQHGAISLQGTSRSRNEDRYDVAVSAQCCSYIDFHAYLGLPHAHAGRSHAAYACSPAALHQPVSDRSSSCAEAGQPL